MQNPSVFALDRVLPDLAFKNYEVGEYISDSDITAWAEWEAQFFDLESALVIHKPVKDLDPDQVEKKKAIKKVPITVKAVRSSVLKQMKGLDKLLCNAFTFGLSHFVVPENQKWTGLAWGEAFPRTLIVSMDQASTGFAAIWFLNYHLYLRCMATYDPFHREWNDARLAVSDEGLWWVILMSTIVYNMPHGPWESCAFWSNIVDMATDYARRASWTSQLFKVLYESICNDLSQLAIGSVDHMKTIFDSCLETRVFKRKGEKVALRRWFGWVDAAHSFDSVFHSFLLVLICLGMTNGIYKTVQDLPLWTCADSERIGLVAVDDNPPPDDDEVEGAVAPAEAQAADDETQRAPGQNLKADEDKGKVTDKDEINKLFRKCKNTIHVATTILCIDNVQYLIRMLLTLLKPIRSEHAANAR